VAVIIAPELASSVLLVRSDALVVNLQLTQGCLHESAQVFRYLQRRLIDVRCLPSDALQILGVRLLISSGLPSWTERSDNRRPWIRT